MSHVSTRNREAHGDWQRFVTVPCPQYAVFFLPHFCCAQSVESMSQEPSHAALMQELMAMERMSQRVKQRASKRSNDVGRLSDEQIQNAFTLFDIDGNGKVPVSELDLMFRSLGMTVDGDIDQMLSNSKINPNDGHLSQDDFHSLVKANVQTMNSEAEAARVFGLVDTDGLGHITFDTMKAALLEADARVSDDELREVLKYCNLSGAAEGVNQKDWLAVMNFVADVGY